MMKNQKENKLVPPMVVAAEKRVGTIDKLIISIRKDGYLDLHWLSDREELDAIHDALIHERSRIARKWL